MIICITNRLLCYGDFLKRIKEIAKATLHAIILRENDLSPDEYETLATRCKEITEKYDATLIINSNIEAAKNLGIDKIHMSVSLLLKHQDELEYFNIIGVSVHSVDEAKQAENLGATYLIAGHIFATDCKKGVTPRGLVFLKEVYDSVSIPVFGIGGISRDNIGQVLNTGAVGGCVMSGLMTCSSVSHTIKEYKNACKGICYVVGA
jgi:thiamine-phosphate pyrophosphorylase